MVVLMDALRALVSGHSYSPLHTPFTHPTVRGQIKAFISSRLDYCNVLYVCVSHASAARLLTGRTSLASFTFFESIFLSYWCQRARLYVNVAKYSLFFTQNSVSSG